ncbi:hypothetical protein H0X32_01650 [Patescibacteria group bacterium]|nr:hypothetical protein [Patescibacteria group bacterium]
MTTEQENNSSHACRKYGFYGSFVGGVWLIVVGAIFLLNNFGYFEGNAWGKLWPLFIIVPGLFMIFRSRSSK